MAERLYKTGDFVELKLISGSKGVSTGDASYISESIITRTVSESEIWIAMPTQNGQVSPIEDGEIYEIRFITSSGSFACRAQVSDDTETDMGNGFGLKLISEITKDCKRMFYRLDKVVPVLYSLREEEENAQMMSGTCFNLSGGGVRFSSGTDIERGRIIQMNLLIGNRQGQSAGIGSETQMQKTNASKEEDEGVVVSGRVIYTDNVGDEDAVYEHRVEFTDIHPDTRERIIRYCFDEANK